MYNCKVCSTKDTDNFYPTNKSVCKNCILCRNKIKRKTVKTSDRDVREYCIRSGIDFDQVCQDSENKKVRLSTTPTQLSSSPLLPTEHPEIQQLQEKIQHLEQTITELTDKINYTNEIMISRTEYNEMGIQEIRRKEEERFQNQEMRHNKLMKELNSIKEYFIDNFYSKDDIINLLNQGFANFAQTNHLKIPTSENK